MKISLTLNYSGDERSWSAKIVKNSWISACRRV